MEKLKIRPHKNKISNTILMPFAMLMCMAKSRKKLHVLLAAVVFFGAGCISKADIIDHYMKHYLNTNADKDDDSSKQNEPEKEMTKEEIAEENLENGTYSLDLLYNEYSAGQEKTQMGSFIYDPNTKKITIYDTNRKVLFTITHPNPRNYENTEDAVFKAKRGDEGRWTKGKSDGPPPVTWKTRKMAD